jgi:multicomponent Na+:H+ antiporter subunit B
MSEDGRMTPVVTTIAALVFPFIMIFSFYIILHGHLTPGGGFQGGAIGASAVIMLIAAYGAKELHRRIRHDSLSILESLGGLIFVVVGLVGFFAASSFMYNFLVGEALFGSNTGTLDSGGFLPILNIAVGIKVIGGLAAVVLVMALSGAPEGEDQ